MSGTTEQPLALGLGLGAPQWPAPDAFASRPPPAGYRWDFVTMGGALVTQGGIPVVDLVRN